MLVDLQAAPVWRNWVGNQSFTPAYAAAPRDEEQVAALVHAASERVLRSASRALDIPSRRLCKPTGCSWICLRSAE